MKIDINTIFEDLTDEQYCDFVGYSSRVEKEYNLVEETRNKVRIKEFKEEVLKEDPQFIKDSKISYYNSEIENKREELKKYMKEFDVNSCFYKVEHNVFYGIYANFIKDNYIDPTRKYIKKMKRNIMLWEIEDNYWENNNSINDNDIERARETDIKEFFPTEGKRLSANLWMFKSPFKEERTPSCAVYQNSNSFYDFSSNKGGDCINFVMEVYNLKFIEAVKFITNKN